ncbi:alpha-2,8-sialyltransferase 8E-like [Conger conger]|uniref:alpha-2,8-sialyltransferase 8E-like n=1 Tax=Conger conger TaxID=82655 RepID=UPI002A5A3ADE|nr:alpha-2,8-sialyltransferase 8E-like [Conger conger]
MANRRRRLKLVLIVCAIAIGLFILIRSPPEIETPTESFPREQSPYCSKLCDQIVAMKSLKGIQNFTKFFLEVKEIMRCPWTSNLTQQIIYKTDLHTHCNSSMLFITRENTKLGQRLTYEVERKATKLVDKILYDMLPETAPWGTSRQFGRCAVVGNGGILKNSSCGEKINTADFVIRLNFPPMNYSSDVGVKSSLVTINPSQVTGSFMGLCNSRKPFVDKAAAYGNAYLAISPFSYVISTDLSFRVFYTMKEMRPQQGVLYIHPDYLLMLSRYWRKNGQTGLRLSSGFMLVSVALELCEKVDIYGFWPFPMDLSQQPVSNHYYDNVAAKQGVHQMSEEFLKLLHMHSQGVLQLHVGKCQ